jgi:hypothetical protein
LRYSGAVLAEVASTTPLPGRSKKLRRYRAFLNGSDGTRTRDLRRDRPAL